MVDFRSSTDQWIKAGAKRYVLSIVQEGYRIPFKKLPESTYLKNNKSARDNPEFVSAEIQRLLEKRCIERVTERPHVVTPLTVAFNRKGKPRLVLDCRHINSQLCTFKFKYEDVSVARQMFNAGDFVFVFDLKSAYHSIEIFRLHSTYLGFAWKTDGKTDYFVYRVLPFGISTAGFIFSKVNLLAISWSQNHHVP